MQLSCNRTGARKELVWLKALADSEGLIPEGAEKDSGEIEEEKKVHEIERVYQKESQTTLLILI